MSPSSPSQPTSTGAFPGPPPNPDVDSKIRLYAAIAALRNSRLPTNAQIADTLQYVKTHSPVDEKKLSPEGRKLVADIREIIGTFSKLVQDKNAGEILQRFVWETRGVDTANISPGDEHKEKGKEHMDKAKLDAQQAAHHLRTLTSLVLTNAEMRKLLTDAVTLGRDLLAKGAAKAAESVAPDPEALRRADDPAPQDQFHEDDPLANAKNQAVTNTLQPSASASSASDDPDSSSSDSDVAGPAEKPKKKSLLGRLQGLKATHKSTLDDGRAWLTDEYFPQERREQWLWRVKKVIIECQKHADYQESVRWLLDTIDAWAIRAREAGSSAKEGEQGQGLLPAATLAADPSLRSALTLLRELLERVANAPLDPVFEAARVLAQDTRNDEALRAWWGDVDGYVRKVLLQVGYVTEPACTTRGKQLRESGHAFYRDKYSAHFDAVVDASAGWFKSMAEDPLNKTFAEDWARLTRDLLFDGEGNLHFKKSLWEDVRGVILPTLVDKVGYIPIPRVEYTDDSLDLVVENLTLSGRHLFPNVVEVEAHNFVRFSPYAAKSAGDAARHEFTFTFAQMHADMRDVAFSFRMKTGPIKMRDSGLADVLLGGQGLTATVTLTSSKDSSSVFSVGRVRVKVGSLKFSIRDTKHDLLYKTFKPLATRLIKKQIRKALQDAIRTGFEYVDGQLVGVRERMAEAKASEDGSRREVLAEMFTRKKEDGASTASSPTGNHSQFKVVANKQGSLFPDRGHPDGWVNRAESAKMAEKGDGWRSDAFEIDGSKKEAAAAAVSAQAPQGVKAL
ncbi:hypothetical protein DFH07DRAFT_886813 [Mycena maculata]|uniref:Uncharacterized protein n=1 Tax=Mycena maculata TaxID=230809 RepID=A0AAD7IYX7_9AGAR|nr:hypothetical protein DFH07DRAFT_886813 [Mycena maculata]